MQFAAAFAEYLITGVVALLWVVPLIMQSEEKIPMPDEPLVLLAIPIIFVLGMCVDTAASFLLKRSKRCLIKRFSRKPDSEKIDPQCARSSKSSRYMNTVTILRSSPELANELRAMVFRDRVARGVCLNALIATAVSTIYKGEYRVEYAVMAPMIAAFTLLMWLRFDNLSSEFKREAVLQIRLHSV